MATVVYVAGPFRAENSDAMREHIIRAKDAAKAVWMLGCVAVLPHTNHGWMWGQMDELTAIEGCLSLVSRCDVLYLSEGWEQSAGACAELETARRYGLLVFDDLDALAAHLAPPAGKPH